MGIRVKASPLLSQYANYNCVTEVNGKTIGQCIKHLVQQFPSFQKVLFEEDGTLRNYVGVYINGKAVYQDKLNSSTNDGDEIYILLMVRGG